MKKVMFAIMMMAVAMVAMADSGNHGSNGQNSNNVEQWTPTSTAYQYASGVFSFTQNGNMQFKLFQPASKNGQVQDFGILFTNDPDSKFSLAKKINGSGKAVFTGNEKFEIKNLKADQKISFYYTTNDKTYVSSDENVFYTLTDTKKDVNYFTFGKPESSWSDGGVIGFTEVSFASGNDKTPDQYYDDEPTFIIYVDGDKFTVTEVIEEEDGGEGGVSGKPLPGVLTTILLGGAVAASARKLRKRKNAAK